MPHAQVNGIQMYYEVAGAGAPLVVINGLAGDLSEIEVLTHVMSDTRRVLVFDNRGAGRTDKPDEPYTIEMMAEDAAGIMDAAGFSAADILGISMGGRIALHLVLSRPERVNKLVLVSTSARVVPNRWRTFALAVLPRIPMLRGRNPQPHYAFQRQAVASRSYDCSQRLHEITAPTAVMYGRRDRMVSAALTEELHRGIAGSRVLPFPGGHLFFLWRDRGRFLAAVHEFLGD
jgi:pimeloyl-ACP methyl ester carboxylesterase